jgi:hypothetical protein
MFRVILSFVAVVFLSSCAQFKTTGEMDVLYNQYIEYISFLNEPNNEAAINMLSQRNIDDIRTHSNVNGFQEYFPVISTINHVLLEEHGSFEEVNTNKGCLSVFGVDTSKEPTSINMEYLNEQGIWKLDYVQVMYHGSKAELPKKTTCPTRM